MLTTKTTTSLAKSITIRVSGSLGGFTWLTGRQPATCSEVVFCFYVRATSFSLILSTSAAVYQPLTTTVRNPNVDPVPVSCASTVLTSIIRMVWEILNSLVIQTDPPLAGHPLDPLLQVRTRLIIDPGVKEINRYSSNGSPVPLDGKFQGSGDTPVDVNLGELRTDDEGRLIVIPGCGSSNHVLDSLDGPMHTEAAPSPDNDDWYDDIFDGWVDVTIDHPQIEGGSVAVAWCFPLRFPDMHPLQNLRGT